MKKDFEEIYSDICQTSGEELQKAKKDKDARLLKTVLICLVIIAIFAIIDKEKFMLIIAAVLCAAGIILVMSKENMKYQKLYKSAVVEKLVKSYNENLNYDPKQGIARMDYTMSHFDNSFDRFISEDGIYGMIGDFGTLQMSEVITKEVRRERDSQGEMREEEIETFRGLFGIVKLGKTSGTSIAIYPNSNLKKYSGKRIEMDSAEFEAYYDCFSENKITALNIFTADVLEEFINLQKEQKYRFELKIENDVLYFRYKCGELFEPPKLKDALYKELIKKYYDTISYPLSIVEKILINLERNT